MSSEFESEESEESETSSDEACITTSSEKSDKNFGEVDAKGSASVEETDHEEFLCAEGVELVTVQAKHFPSTEKAVDE